MNTRAEHVQGVLLGTVTATDPSRGSVKVNIAERGHDTDWAPIAAAMSGNGRGAYFMPEIGDEVVVAFDRGRFDQPYVMGFLWNGKDAPPSLDGHLRIIKSVNGHEIRLFDPAVESGDQGYVRIEDAHGNSIELANGLLTIKGIAAIRIDAPLVAINGRVVAPSGSPI